MGPVEVEEQAGDGYGCVAEEEAYVGLRVDLAEFEAVEIVGEGVVGRVFQI